MRIFAPKQSFYYRMKTLSDREMVQGLIDRDESCVRMFQERFRAQVYESIDEIYDELSASPPKTDRVREELFLALCDNLHVEEDQQLKEFLSDENNSSLENWFVNVKLPLFMPERIIVYGLRNLDRKITTMFVASNHRLSLQKILDLDRLRRCIKDIDNGGKPMSRQKLITLIYEVLMLGEEKKKGIQDEDIGHKLDLYRNEGDNGLGGYICSLLPDVRRLANYQRGKRSGREKDFPAKYEVASPVCVDVDQEELNCFIQKVFQEMSLTDVGHRDAVLLEERYLMGTSLPEMARSRGWKYNNMCQRIDCARKRFRDVCIEKFGAKTYNQIMDYYEKD